MSERQELINLVQNLSDVQIIRVLTLLKCILYSL